MFEQRVKELAEKGYILERSEDTYDDSIVFRLMKDGRIIHRKVFLRDLLPYESIFSNSIEVLKFNMNRIIDEMIAEINKENENA